MEVKVPDIGDFTDVPVIEIHVAPGDQVKPEDPLVTLESDKATMDVPSPAAGVVREVLVKLEDKVSEGTPLLVLEPQEAEGEAPSSGRAGEGAEPQEQGAAVSEPAAESAPQRESEPQAGAPAQPAGERTELPPADRQAQLVVIGAGVGGYSAAFRAADLGLDVILVERDEVLGGVCLNVGCIPSKALLHAAKVLDDAREAGQLGIEFGEPRIELERLREFKREVVGKLTGGLDALAKRRRVEVLRGTARFTSERTLDVDGTSVAFEHCIVAAGSEPARLPGLPEDERIIDSTGALELPDVPERLLVVGGGIIGLEMATVYAALGSAVTVVELTDQLIPGCDPDLVRPLEKRIRERYEAILLGTRVAEVEAGERLRVSFEGEDAPEPQEFDRVLVAVGRRANGDKLGLEAAGVTVDERGLIAVDSQLRTNVPHILAIGDIVGEPMLAHKASHQGKVAAEIVAGRNVELDVRAIPSVAYTDPEIAWTGLTEAEAVARDIAYEKSSFPWSASGRALGLGRPEGLTKILVDPSSRRVLGYGIVGPNAGELIAEATLAIEMGAEAEDLALTIHPHPTLSETVMFAAEMVEGTITDLYAPKRDRS